MEPNEQQKKTKRYVTISLALHAALFLSFGVGSFFAPQSLVFTPAVQIDMVALPNKTKNQEQEPVDTSLPVKPDPPPEPEKEAKADPEPEPAKPDPDEMALEKEKERKEKDAAKRAKDALKKMREQAEKERKAEEDRKKEALDKRKDDLKRFEKTYREALRGNQKNDGSSMSGEMQAAVNAYQGHMLDRIRSKWALPQYLQGKGHRAVMRMYLDPRGNVIRMEFKQVSGNNMFDSYVEGAIRQSSPFFPPPAEMAPGLKSSGVEVQFPL